MCIHVHICTLWVCVWGSGGGAVPGLVFIQTHISPVYAGEIELTWQGRGMGAVPRKASCWGWTGVHSGAACALSSVPTSPAQQPTTCEPPSSLGCSRCHVRRAEEGRWAWALSPGFPQPTTCCQMELGTDGVCAGNGSWLPASPWPCPCQLGHSYALDVQETELAGLRSPGTELGEENSQPSRRDLRNSRIAPQLPLPPPWAPHCLPSLGICRPPSVQHHTTPSQPPASYPFAVLFIAQTPP